MSTPARLRLSGALAASALVPLALLAGGCGSTRHARAAAGQVLNVTESDFQIIAPTGAKAGDVVLHVANHGPDQHELIVVPANSSGLPLRGDGLTVDEEVLERSEPGLLEPGQPGSVRDLHLHLAPGRYVLFCNMEGHYQGGMHRELVVSA